MKIEAWMILIAHTFLLLISSFGNCESTCLNLDISITQKVEHEGFHRNILWLIETTNSSKPGYQKRLDPNCKFAIRQDVSNYMFVNPDEVAELSRKGKLVSYIDGQIDVEAPAHEASEHVVYIYLNSSGIERTSIDLPIHLRYQRSQITGGYGKILLKKPSLLFWCPDSLDKICGREIKVEAPCDENGYTVCIWRNLTYQALFDEVEMYVPVGDLDDYPLVSLATLLLGCAGCIYILSVLSTTPL